MVLGAELLPLKLLRSSPNPKPQYAAVFGERAFREEINYNTTGVLARR